MGFKGPGFEQGALVIAGSLWDKCTSGTGGRKRWRNVFMRSKCRIPDLLVDSFINLWIFFFDYGVYLLSTSIGPERIMAWSLAFYLWGHWNEQTMAYGIVGLHIEAGVRRRMVLKERNGDSRWFILWLHLLLAFYYAETTMASRASWGVSLHYSSGWKVFASSSVNLAWPGTASPLRSLGVDISALAVSKIRF